MSGQKFAGGGYSANFEDEGILQAGWMIQMGEFGATEATNTFAVRRADGQGSGNINEKADDLALKVQEKLKENNIDSKVVSMPCMELFDKQPKNFQNDIIDQDSLVVTLEAGSIMSWQKYIKNKGMNVGIDQFGESAPYKEVYNHFGLSEEKITNFIQKKLRE